MSLERIERCHDAVPRPSGAGEPGPGDVAPEVRDPATLPVRLPAPEDPALAAAEA